MSSGDDEEETEEAVEETTVREEKRTERKRVLSHTSLIQNRYARVAFSYTSACVCIQFKMLKREKTLNKKLVAYFSVWITGAN